MKVLHINVSAIRDRFYLTLFSSLKKKGVIQTIYTPYRRCEYNESEFSWVSESYEKQQIEIILSPIKTLFDRALYNRKIRKYARHLIQNVEIESFDLIHAHSLYSNGGVAYETYKRFNIPYIVAVRSTDIEYMNIFPYLNEYACEILFHASKVIYISPDLKQQAFDRLFKTKRNVSDISSYEIKSNVIPNGVDEYWLDNVYKNKVGSSRLPIKMIQVSRLEKRKNVDVTVDSVYILRQKGINTHLTIVGDGTQRDYIKKLVRKRNLEDNVTMTGFISDKQRLLELYRTSDIFIMPSKGETFGISYIEAMTQGLPVVGLKGTGVSGYFSHNEVGIFVKESDPQLVAEAILTINQLYEGMSNNCLMKSAVFKWDAIIDKNLIIYNDINNSKR